MNIIESMQQFGHERILFHQDPATGLRAIIAIHSTVLGNALGGTRRWYYPSEEDALYDVLRLSEGMTYKSAAAGLPMGGAKSVILLDEPGQPGAEAEARAMGRFVDTVNGTYIAAEDVGVNTQFVDWMGLETPHVMGGEQVSRGGDPSPFTARGVFNGMKACLAHVGRPVDFNDLTIAIQGVGSVGYSLAEILIDHGAKLLVADINQKNLERAKLLSDRVTVVDPQSILTSECDILAPCALGGVIDGNLGKRLRTKIICGAANNVLVDPDEDAVLLKNAGVVYGTDFVVNAGGVIELAGLYLGYSREQLDRMNEAIEATTLQVLRQAETLGSSYAAAVAVAKERIAEGAKGRREAGSAGRKVTM